MTYYKSWEWSIFFLKNKVKTVTYETFLPSIRFHRLFYKRFDKIMYYTNKGEYVITESYDEWYDRTNGSVITKALVKLRDGE